MYFWTSATSNFCKMMVETRIENTTNIENTFLNLRPKTNREVNNKMCALPGNRTRVTRMGILYDTTTPAVLETGKAMMEIKLRGEKLAVETKTSEKRRTLTWKRN